MMNVLRFQTVFRYFLNLLVYESWYFYALSCGNPTGQLQSFLTFFRRLYGGCIATTLNSCNQYREIIQSVHLAGVSRCDFLLCKRFAVVLQCSENSILQMQWLFNPCDCNWRIVFEIALCFYKKCFYCASEGIQISVSTLYSFFSFIHQRTDKQQY